MRERPEQYRVRFKDLAEDTIEKCWIPLWGHVQKQELSPDLAEMMIKLHFMSESDCGEIIEKLMKKKDFATGIIHKSMVTRFNIEMSLKAQLWLILLFESPGNSVMLFAYMKWVMHQKHLTKIDFDTLNMYVFPLGYPNQEDMQWLWDCQKLKAETDEEFRAMPGTGNLLDCPIAYTSFL